MGNLLVSIISSANAMRAFERGVTVVQSNVANASTPGYAKQIQTFHANAFQLDQGLPGGVTAGEVLSTRNAYAEDNVRRQMSAWGYADQKRASLSQIEPAFDIQPGAGVPGALTALFQSFSQLAVSPNNTAARRVVLDRAQELAVAFQRNATELGRAMAATDREINAQVEKINHLIDRLAQFNIERRSSFETAKDAGLDAELHASLEELSEFANLTILHQDDGTVSVLLGGQTPIVIGERGFKISADISSGSAKIRNAQGDDITAQITSGRLGALLELRNTRLPAYTADLNQLAQSVANRVNTILAGGLDLNGNPPTQNLFSYNAALGAAATLQVNNLTPSELAAALPTAPGGNGNALQLAALASSPEISGFTFVEFYGNLAGRVGADLASARSNTDTNASLLSQARTLRAQASHVELDEEAAQLIQFQRSYQAVAKLVTVLNDMTDTLVGLIK
jgi:flagellar hook-associated protein 1 FlgK